MIITKEIRPENQIYPIGAFILGQLKNIPEDKIEAFELYELVNRLKPISLNTFFLGLDWLFLIDAVKEQDGVVLKCF